MSILKALAIVTLLLIVWSLFVLVPPLAPYAFPLPWWQIIIAFLFAVQLVGIFPMRA